MLLVSSLSGSGVWSGMNVVVVFFVSVVFFFQAEDGIRDLVRSRGLGDVYKRQPVPSLTTRQIDSKLPSRIR